MQSGFMSNTPDDAELKQLEALEAEADKNLQALEKGGKPSDTPLAGDRAPAGQPNTDATPKTQPTDAPSAAEKQEVETAKAEAEKEGKELDTDDKGVPKRDAQGKFVKLDKPAAAPAIQLTADERKKFDAYLAEKQGSKYAKDFNRRLVTWTELNAAKDEFDAKQRQAHDQLQAAVKKFNADVAEFQTSREASTPTPEKYEAFATKQENLATVKEAEAVKAEAAGDFDGAEKLRDEAKFARRDAAAAKASAEHVRKNPPLNAKQQADKFVADQKTWVDKAAIDFPEFAKKDSPTFKGAVEYFKQMTANDPVVAKLPGFIYFCAERASLKTASDGVPALEKELGELRTKVKELEELTNPAPSGAVARQPAAQQPNKLETPSDLERELAELKEMAANLR